MPMQQVEYEFPDPEKEKNLQEVEIPEQEPETPDIEVEGAVGRETIEKPSQKKENPVVKAGDMEIEIEDDAPPQDRGKKTTASPDEVTDEELSHYSKGVRKRIKQLTYGVNNERRAKETALREREALEQYTKTLLEENEKLKKESSSTHNAFIATAKQAAEVQLEAAKQQYKAAYDAGETDALLEAQTLLNSAQTRLERVKGLRPKPATDSKEDTTLQPEQNTVQSQELAPQKQPQRDEKAEAWRDENPWFGADDEMTAFALGLHSKLTKEGTDPRSDEYYEKINSRMRQVFPDQFDDGIDDEPEEAPKQKSSTVVAPATRSTSSRKVKLSQSQIAIARRLGVPLEKYAQQVTDLSRKQNG